MKVMTIYAHPADTITNCGGTLALHAKRGDEVVAQRNAFAFAINGSCAKK